jgi:tight adherence protein B
MLPMLLTAVLAFVAIAGVGFVLAGGSGQSKVAKRAQAIAERGRPDIARPRKAETDANARRKQILKNLKDQERQQKKQSLTLRAKLLQAGLSISVRTFWIIRVVLGVVVLLICLVAVKTLWISLVIGLAAGAALPHWFLGFLCKRRTKKYLAAFPDAADIIVRGIKSGLPVHECLKIIAKEAPDPLGAEFRRVVENVGMGMTLDQALEKSYERMPLPELRFFSIVLGIQQKTGGNLAEALGNLSTVLRARKMMREKIKAMSGEATASATIIGALPPAVILLISITTPSYMAVLFTDKRGHLILMAGAFLMAVGIWVMRRMINFKF